MKPKRSVIEGSKYCVVPGCVSHLTDGEGTPVGIQLFPFPTDPQISSRWCHILSSSSRLKSPLQFSSSAVICHLHFKRDCLKVSPCGKQWQLKAKAEPSVFPWTEKDWQATADSMLQIQPNFSMEDGEEDGMEEHHAHEHDDMENGEYALPIKKRRRLQESALSETQSPEKVDMPPPYCEGLLQKMAELQKDGLFCDVVLKSTSSDKSYMAHKVVLASCSSYLKELLSEQPQAIAVLNMDVSDASIQDLLDFLYTGVLSLHENTVPELCTIATNWNIMSLLKLCKGDDDEVPVKLPPDFNLNTPTKSRVSTENDLPGALNLTINNQESLDRCPLLKGPERRRSYTVSPISTSPREEHGLEHREQDPFLGVTIKQEPCEDSRSQGDSNTYDTDVASEMDYDRPTADLDAGHSPLRDTLDNLDRRIIGSVHLDEATAEQLLPPGMKPEPDEGGASKIHLTEVDDLEEMMMWKYRDDEDGDDRSHDYGNASDASKGNSEMHICRCYVCKVLFPNMGECVNHMVESHGITKEAALLVLHSSHMQSGSTSSREVAIAPRVVPEPGKTNIVTTAKLSNQLTRYQCTVCTKHYATLSRCRSHIRSAHGQHDKVWEEEPYHCYICQMTFPNAQEGRAHSIVVHCHGQRRKVGENNKSNGEAKSKSDTAPVDVSKNPSSTNGSTSGRTDTVTILEPSKASSSSAVESTESRGQVTDMYPFPNHPYQCKFCKTVFEFLDECENHIMETHNIAADLVYVCYTRRKNRYRRISNRSKKTTTTADAQPSSSAAATTNISNMPSFASFSASRVSDPPKNLPYKCRVDPDNCLQRFQSPLDQEHHNFLDHGIPLPAWVNDFECPKCVKKYRNKAALSSHLTKMHEPSEWT